MVPTTSCGQQPGRPARWPWRRRPAARRGRADLFVFSALDEIAGDRIADFRHLQGDRIDLSALDPLGAADSLRFIGGRGFGGHAGELHVEKAGGDTLVSGDLDGDRAADFHLVLTGNVYLVAADFLL
ncbi:hypothetical protein D3874_09640 [Oleomonas cavernae]|uniref:Peptidase M10 serralysin C-terminal domain-containing protein n=1 Tax=Oleomonas cavernae TaxID=2320859 RepID=A0A418WB86_9PROT|nr:hypothetical protein [Oleomonas cavernae]RJF87260.1 hypothetical protein D3874_09640 [Oleomonas cavernae]